ncbi:MAG: hypothetical protein IKO41_05875 [Lachnospiraceae bacterium]|nr:hypothetical protein [Lachnospiraceae bacterium]
MIVTIRRPKEITSDVLWELYQLLYTMENPYLFYEARTNGQKKDELFYVESICIGDQGLIYGGYDNMGMELPTSKNEWVELMLTNLENGRKQRFQRTIWVNALYVNHKSVQDLLAINDLRLSTGKELQDVTYEARSLYDGIPKIPLPSYSIPVEVHKTIESKRRDTAWRNAHSLAFDMSMHQIAFRQEEQKGLTTQEIFFAAEHVPGGILRGTIQYFDLAAEFKLFIPPVYLEKYVGIEQKEELLRFLNEVNARILPRYQADTVVTNDTKSPFSWRIYYARKTVCLVTMIPFLLWGEQRRRTHGTILKDSPKFMDQLSQFIMDILSGEKMTDEAITELEQTLFGEHAIQGQAGS